MIRCLDVIARIVNSASDVEYALIKSAHRSSICERAGGSKVHLIDGDLVSGPRLTTISGNQGAGRSSIAKGLVVIGLGLIKDQDGVDPVLELGQKSVFSRYVGVMSYRA